MKVPVWSGSGEGCLLGLQVATFSLGPHMEERERAPPVSLLIRALIPLDQGSTLMAYLTLIASQRPHLQIIPLGVQALTHEWGVGTQHSVHNNETRLSN